MNDLKKNTPIRHVQMSESLQVGLLLAVVGGFLESYSFLCRDGVFANCQTGNMVLMAMYLSQSDWLRTFAYLIPILSFFIGVILTECIRTWSGEKVLHWRQYIILIEIILLTLVGFIPSGKYNGAATTLIAFSCSMQVESFRKVKGSVFATTMCTGNLRSGTYQLFQSILTKDKQALHKSGHYFSIIAIFMAGAVLGGLTTNIFGEKAIWISSLLLLIVFFILFIRKDDNEISLE